MALECQQLTEQPDAAGYFQCLRWEVVDIDAFRVEQWEFFWTMVGLGAGAVILLWSLSAFIGFIVSMSRRALLGRQ